MDLLQRPASKVPPVVEVSLGDEGWASISKRAPFISAVMHGDCESRGPRQGIEIERFEGPPKYRGFSPRVFHL